VAFKSKSSADAGAKARRRSAFREEFYADRRPSELDAAVPMREARRKSRRRTRKVSFMLPVFSLFFLLCIIAVAGSSAMIWLRKLGALFGVEWSGDG
jgi:hypothetical protein